MHGRRYADSLMRAAAPDLARWGTRRRDTLDRVMHAALDVSDARDRFAQDYPAALRDARTRGEAYFRVAYRAGQEGYDYATVAPFALLAYVEAGVRLEDAYQKGAERAGRSAEPRTRTGKRIEVRAFTFGEFLRTHAGWTRGDHYDAAAWFRAQSDAARSARNYPRARYMEKMAEAHGVGVGGHYGAWSAAIHGVVEPDDAKDAARSPLTLAARVWREMGGTP